MKRVLVTGANGFVGTNLVRELIKTGKYKPVCFFRGTDKKNALHPKLEEFSDKIETIKGDMKNYADVEKAVKDVYAVLHLAASVSSKDEKANYDINVGGAENLIKACKKHDVNRIIFTSTFIAAEKRQCNYGYTKMLAEQVFNKSDIDVTILRPGLVYGPGGKGFTKIVGVVKKLPIFIPILGSGNYNRRPVYVGDVVKAVIAALENDKTKKKTYFIGGPETITFRNMLKTVEKELSLSKIIFPIPIWLCNMGASLLEMVFKTPPISKRDISSITNQNSQTDISEAKRDLNHNPLTFKEGVRKSLIDLG